MEDSFAVIVGLLHITIATIVYRIGEDWTWVDSFYFSIVAVTTVGFGDFSPTTNVTKLYTVFYVLVGISLIGVVLNETLRRHATRIHDRRSPGPDD